MKPQLTNLVVRSFIWLGGLAWWVYLRKPTASGLLDVRPGLGTVVGILLMVVGLAVYLWAACTLASSVPSAIAPPAFLLMRGPYRYVRNLLYLGAVAVFVGVSTVYAPWQARDLFAVGLVAILIHLFVVRREEPLTRQRLGAAYDEYCARVPRWIPKFSQVRPSSLAQSCGDRQTRGADGGEQAP